MPPTEYHNGEIMTPVPEHVPGSCVDCGYFFTTIGCGRPGGKMVCIREFGSAPVIFLKGLRAAVAHATKSEDEP